MTETIFLFALILKHAFADIFLQTYIKYPYSKNQYIGNGHRHYAHHGIANFIICLFFVSPIWALIYSLFDYVAHWHIDWAKTIFVKKISWSRQDNRFWRLQSLDQMLHYSTGFLIVLHAHMFVL